MSLLDLIALCLAADAMLTAWFHGTIFANVLSWVDGREQRQPNFVTGALSCPRCLAYHVPFWLAAVFYVTSLFLVSPWDVVVKLPLYALAATSVVHFLQNVHPLQDKEEVLDGPEEEVD